VTFAEATVQAPQFGTWKIAVPLTVVDDVPLQGTTPP
jgi:hypothetical protein